MLKLLFSAFASVFLSSAAVAAEPGFVSLFDGKTLDGWKLSGDPAAFTIKDGAIVAQGDCAHAFYQGKEKGGKFGDFELRMEVMTEKNSNGGVFIHTAYQEQGWPAKGYEIQVNNTQGDWKKSGGIYNVVDTKEPQKDNVWMKYVIIVKNGKITSRIDGKTIAEHKPEKDKSKLLEGGGEIALQAHDKGSIVHYKNIRIKSLD